MKNVFAAKPNAPFMDSAAFFQQFMDQSPLLAWVNDADTILQYMNAPMRRICGLKTSDLGKSIFDLFPEKVAADYHAGNLAVLKSGKGSETLEQIILPDGSERIYRAYKFPLFVDGQTMVAGWSMDVTQAIEDNERLIHSVERYSLVQKAVSDAMYDCIPHRKVIEAGVGFKEIFGIEQPQFSLRSFLKRVHPADQSRVIQSYAGAMYDLDVSQWTLHYRIRRADGSYSHVLDRGIIQRSGAAVTRIIGAIRDVTAEHLLQQELMEAEKKAKRKLVRSVVEAQEKERRRLSVELHDNVNQLLASCKLMLEVAHDGGPHTSMFLERCKTGIVDAIAEIRKISHELNPSALEDVGLFYAVRQLAEELNATGQLSLSVETNIDDATLVRSNEDDITIYRLIQEQVSNILKHSKAKHVHIKLKQYGATISLDIIDDGVGMNLSELKKGLGLKNMQNRVDYYQGQFDIKSEVGKGTAISILLSLHI